MAFMVRSIDSKEVEIIFRKMVTALSTNDHDVKENAQERLLRMNMRGFDDFMQKKDTAAPVHPETEATKQHVLTYRRSKFDEYFNKIVVELENKLMGCNLVNSNNFLYQDLVHYIRDHFIPIVSMWSGIILHYVESNISHLHNQYVESHLNNIKTAVLDEETKLSNGRLIRRLKNYTTTLVKSVSLNVIRKKGRVEKPTFPQREDHIPSPTDPLVEKSWQKGKKRTRRKKSTHFSGRYFEKYANHKIVEETEDTSDETEKADKRYSKHLKKTATK